jgi:hypothetical protein
MALGHQAEEPRVLFVFDATTTAHVASFVCSRIVLLWARGKRCSPTDDVARARVVHPRAPLYTACVHGVNQGTLINDTVNSNRFLQCVYTDIGDSLENKLRRAALDYNGLCVHQAPDCRTLLHQLQLEDVVAIPLSRPGAADVIRCLPTYARVLASLFPRTTTVAPHPLARTRSDDAVAAARPPTGHGVTWSKACIDGCLLQHCASRRGGRCCTLFAPAPLRIARVVCRGTQSSHTQHHAWWNNVWSARCAT